MAEVTPERPTNQSGWRPIIKFGEAVAWVAALCGSIVTIVNALPVISQAATEMTDTIFHPMPTNLAVFFGDDQPFANQYLTILAQRGFDARYEPLGNLAEVIKSENPGIVFLQSDNFKVSDSITLDDTTRSRLSKRTKIIGVGTFGASFIHELDPASMVGEVMQISQTTAMLDDPDKPKDVGQGLPVDSLVRLFDQDTTNPMLIAAAYDFGSTANQQPPAEGIARVTGGEPKDPCKGAHWTIVVQADLALWGYQLPAATLSDQGRQLFGDLAVHMRQTGYVQSEQQFAQTLPGTLQGQLGCSLTTRTYRFRPAGAGSIAAKASAQQPVAMILNAPYQVNAIARQDGPQPQFTIQVQQQQLERPGDWTLTIAYFGDVQPNTKFQYSVDLDYPYVQPRSTIWLIAAAAALILGSLASWRLIVILRRRSVHRAAT